MKPQLDRNVHCFEYYKTRFNATDWTQIKSKLISLCSPAYASRSSLRRRAVNAAYLQKKKDTKTVTQALNDYKMSTSLANYRLCVKCEEYYLSSGAVEIITADPLYEELKLGEKQELQMMNCFWLCLVCKSSSKKHEESLSVPLMKSIQVDGHTILYPTNENQQGDIVINTSSLILFPKCYSKGKFEKNWYVKMYNNQEPTNAFISTLYKMRLAKFMSRYLFSDFYSGEIQQLQNRRLNSISKIVDTSMIRSSDSWLQKRKNAIFSNFQQYGQFALGFSIDINMNNVETIMTRQVCTGDVISLDYQADVNGEFLTRYFKHSHDKTVACNPNCDLTEIRPNDEYLEANFIPLYISSVSQKQAGFIQNIVKNTNSDLNSEDFFCGVDFDLSGKARLNGLLWTFECNIFNKALSSTSFDGTNLETADILHYLQKTILTTVNRIDIRDNLGVNDEEANKIQNLAQRFQVNLNMKHEFVPLPSYETMVRSAPDEISKSNINSSKSLLLLFKNCLLHLSEEEKTSLTTEGWLEKMSRKATFDMHDDHTIYIVFEDRAISFNVHEALNLQMTKFGPFVGLYNYALSCSNKPFSIVMRRLHILDCYTVPYHSTMLKAFHDKIELTPIYSMSQWFDFQDKYSEEPPNLENTELSELLNSHSLMSLPEIYALSDPKKVRDIVSATVEFVCPCEENKPKFRKVRVRSQETYELPGVGYFEELSNNILRHNRRINGRDLLLVESSLWYDKIPQKNAVEILNTYKETPDKIPDGDILGVYGSMLPTYILCNNDQILKLRRKRKCLQTPQYTRLSKEEKFARVMLFYPLRPGETIHMDRLDDYFYATSNTVRDSNQQVLTIIEVNER